MNAEGLPAGSRARKPWPRPWFIAISGLALLVWWIAPLVHPRGAYAGHYRYFDLEIGLVAALVWLAVAAVGICPIPLRRAFTIRLVTVLGALLISAALCDAVAVFWSVRVARFWYFGMEFARRENVPDPELIWKHRPALSWHGRKTPDCEEIDFRTDENGFRNPPGIRQADVVFLGDSVTEAGEVADEHTFAQKTAAALGLTAVNLGVFGYGPQQELAVLKRYGFAYRPRVVVWQVTEWNDLNDAELYRHRDEPGRWSLPTGRDLYERHSPIVGLLAWVVPPRRRLLVAFQRTDGLVERRAIRPFVESVSRHPAGLEETQRAIATAQALCRERGVVLVVLLVPDHSRILGAYARPPVTGHEVDDLTHALTAFSRRQDCPLIDLAPSLRQRAALDNRHVYVKNDTHLDRDGHDETARALVQWFHSRDDLTLGSNPQLSRATRKLRDRSSW